MLTHRQVKSEHVLKDSLLELMTNDDGNERIEEEFVLVLSGAETPCPRQTVRFAADACYEQVQIDTARHRAVLEAMIRTRPATF